MDATSRQANFAMFSIGAVGVLEVLGCAFDDLDGPGILCRLLGYATWVAAAFFFCRWLYRAYGDVALLQGPPLRFKPREAVVSFFVPWLALYRPYQAMVDLHAASDPDSGRVLGERGVRDRALARGWEKAFPVRAWWALWLLAPWLTGALDNASVVTQLMNPDKVADPWALLLSVQSGGDGLLRGFAALIYVALSVLAVCVIRSIVARQRARLRRLEATLAS